MQQDEKRETSYDRRIEAYKETDELLTLQEMLPELLQRGRLKEAEGAICHFLDRNPWSTEGFVLLAEAHAYQKEYLQALCALWGAIHNCPGNRRLLRLVAQYEESFLMERCELPLMFKMRALQESQCDVEKKKMAQRLHSPLYEEEGAPVMISRQGCHTAAFANQDLSPGDLIFKEKPFVCTPLMMQQGAIFSSCFHCLQERADPARAFSCPVSPQACPFVFCSWECLVRNGRLHSVECGCMPMIYAAARESGVNVTSVLHIFRTLVKAAMQRALQPPRDSEEKDDVAMLLLRLNSYEEAVKEGQPELFKRVTLLAKRFQAILPPHLYLHLNERELIHLILVVLQYSPFVSANSAAAAVERRNPETTLGRILAPATAMLHHSCVPTAIICLQEDGQVAVRALTFIPSGGYVCLSVEEDLFKPQNERKAIESPPRVFGCGCVRCTDNEEGGRLLRGIRCTSCVRGFLCPVKGEAMQARLRAYEKTGILTGPMLAKLKDRVSRTVTVVKSISLMRKGKKTPEAPARAQRHRLKNAEEQWLCNACGRTSSKFQEFCASLEEDLLKRQAAAESFLVKGSNQLARRTYGDLIDEYSAKLHPQHHVLFNAHIILAGLLASQGGRHLPRVR